MTKIANDELRGLYRAKLFGAPLAQLMQFKKGWLKDSTYVR